MLRINCSSLSSLSLLLLFFNLMSCGGSSFTSSDSNSTSIIEVNGDAESSKPELLVESSSSQASSEAVF